MKVNKTFKLDIELYAYVREDREGLKTCDCVVGGWDGEELCKDINLSMEIARHLNFNKRCNIKINIEEV